MSGYIEIDKKPVIFDDKKYCFSEIECCENLDGGKCLVFKKTELSQVRMTQYEPNFAIFYAYKKCHECLQAWKEAKEKHDLTSLHP